MALSAGICMLEISKSPPSNSRALPEIPAFIASATDPTAPIAATPSINAPRNTLKRATEPRISKRAYRHASPQLIFVVPLCELSVMPHVPVSAVAGR